MEQTFKELISQLSQIITTDVPKSGYFKPKIVSDRQPIGFSIYVMDSDIEVMPQRRFVDLVMLREGLCMSSIGFCSGDNNEILDFLSKLETIDFAISQYNRLKASNH